MFSFCVWVYNCPTVQYLLSIIYLGMTAPTFHSTKETTNYARLCRLLVDVGAHVLRETFDNKRPTGNLDTVLSTPPTHAILQTLRTKRVLNPTQWGKLYPAIKSSVSSTNFDITLLMVLLRNICGLVPPATGTLGQSPSSDRFITWSWHCSHQALQKHSLRSCQRGLSWWCSIQSILEGYPGCIGEIGRNVLPRCYWRSEDWMHGPWFRGTLPRSS